MKGQKILKVTSILMIIGGVIAVIAGILGYSRHQRSGSAVGKRRGRWAALRPAPSLWLWHLSFSSLLALRGIGACSAPQKAASCIKWGIIIAVLSIISMIIGLIGGGEFSIVSLVLNLLLPGLYIFSAVQMKGSTNA